MHEFEMEKLLRSVVLQQILNVTQPVNQKLFNFKKKIHFVHLHIEKI